MQPTLTLSFIFPNGAADDFSVTYGTATAVPIPVLGDTVAPRIGSSDPGLKVTARTWNYDAAHNIFLYITCG